jgi:hypothetical protein
MSGSLSGSVCDSKLPPDILAHYFPGGDHPEMPVDTLISIPNIWEPLGCTIIMPGVMRICKTQPGASVTLSSATMEMPFLLCIPGDPMP